MIYVATRDMLTTSAKSILFFSINLSEKNRDETDKEGQERKEEDKEDAGGSYTFTS
jgi:hypothetical protein